MSEHKTTIPKRTVEPGKYVIWQMAIECLDVSPTRLTARPKDEKLIGEQIDYRKEEGIYDGQQMDSVFKTALAGLAKGGLNSVEVQYPEYEPANIIAIERSVLLTSGIKPASLRTGLTLGRDLLRGKCKLDEEGAELEIIEMKNIQ